MDKYSSLPEKIIQLIENKTFEQLSREEQNEVLNFLTLEEYHQFHQLQKQIKLNLQQDKSINPSDSLNRRFAASINEGNPTRRMVPLWQAAAGFILPLGAWLFTLIVQSEQQTLVKTLQDTVYVSVVKPEYILKKDTVIVYKEVPKKNNPNLTSQKSLPPIHNINPSIQPVEAGIRVIDREELQYHLEQRKNSSMAEDSIYRRIGYTGI